MKLFAAIITMAAAAMAADAASFALCVGIDRYDENYIPEYCWLSQCRTDGEAVSDMLVSACGWEPDDVLCLYDEAATREAIREGLGQIADLAVAGDRVVVYQSSHGVRLPWGESCLCAYDDDVYVEDIADALLRFRADVRLLVVVDACYSGGLFAAPAAEAAEELAQDVTTCLAWADRPPVGWITSAAEDELVYELADGPGAMFSRAWTQAISSGAADSVDAGGDGDGELTALESFSHACDMVGGYSTPQCPYPEPCRSFVLRRVASVPLSDVLGIAGTGRPGGWFALETEGDGAIARSGAILDEQTSAMETTVEGFGTLSFEWWVSSEEPGDVLSLSLDGRTVASVSGLDGGWRPVTVDVTGSGTHVVRWTYAKDWSRSAGEDAGRIRNLVWDASRGAFLPPAEAARRLADPEADQPPDGETATYVGYLCDETGAAVGTVWVKAMRRGRDGLMRTSVTVTKRSPATFRGYYDPALWERQVISTRANAPEILIGDESLSGVYDGCRIIGVREGAFSGPVGVFPIVWPETSSSADVARSGGWNALSLSVDRYGKVRFVGRLADGTGVCASSRLLAGSAYSCAVLVTKRTALTVWLDNAGAGPDARGYPGIVADVLGTLDGVYRFSVESDAATADVPIAASGRRWQVIGENPARLKLSYDVRTGLFRGSCRTGAKMYGAVVGGKGYGSFVVRRVGVGAVKIER